MAAKWPSRINNLYGIDRLRSAPHSPALRSFCFVSLLFSDPNLKDASVQSDRHTTPILSLLLQFLCNISADTDNITQPANEVALCVLLDFLDAAELGRVDQSIQFMPASRYPAFSTPASRARSTRRVERPLQSAAATAPAVERFLGSSPSEHLTDELEGQGFNQPIMGSHGAISRANFLSRPAGTRSHYQDRCPGYCRLRHQSGHCQSSQAFCASPCQL